MTVPHGAPPTLRLLTPADLPAVLALEAASYLDTLLVSPEAFRRLIDLYPAGAIGAFDDGALCGFIFGLPLRSGQVLDLREPLEAIPEAPDVFYVHDIAVAADCRGRGVGRRLAQALLDTARRQGFTRAELVSVQGSAPFWARFGFAATRTFDYAPGAESVAMTALL